MGTFVPISVLLFCLVYASTQAWLSQRRFNCSSLIWIGGSLAGLLAAGLSAIALIYLLIFLLRLDILQNSQHGAIASIIIIISFGSVMILSQWFILRSRVNAPIPQACLNVILGTITWFLLTSRILEYAETAWGLPVFILLSIVLSAGLSSLIHKILN